MENNFEEDDIDLFVSPGRFSGRTPSAATTRAKIFQEFAAAEEKLQKQAEEEYKLHTLQKVFSRDRGFDDGPLTLFPTADRRNMPDPTFARSFEKQARAKRAICAANWLAASLGVCIMVLGAWISTQRGNPGITAIVRVKGYLWREPFYYGVLLLLAGFITFVFGAFLGGGLLPDALASGFYIDGKRKFLAFYILLIIASCCCFSLVAASSALLFYSVHNEGLNRTTWNKLSPALICRYEKRNGCVGLEKNTCAETLPPSLLTCPGHLCSKLCANSTPSSYLQKCKICLPLVTSGTLQECSQFEKRKSANGGCGKKMLTETKFMLMWTITGSCLGLLLIILVLAVDISAPRT